MAWIKQIGKLLILVFLQWAFFNHLLIAGICFPMFYILFLIGLPGNCKPWVSILIGAAVGLMMDMLYSSLGIHMAACTLLSFIRTHILLNSNQDIDRLKEDISGHSIGFMTYVRCCIILTLIHHATVFLLDAGFCPGNWWIMLLQIVGSSMMTIILLLGYDRLRYAK